MIGPLVTLLGLASAALLLLPAWSDVLSLAKAMFRRAPRPHASSAPPRFIFLVPAHDEAGLIASCIRSIRALRYPAAGRKVVVLADNCADRTAELARAAGAAVLERHDPTRPGKPEALAWALPRLPLDAYDAVVIVDADAVVDAEFAIQLATHAPLADKVVQCYDDVRNREASSLTQMAAVLSAGRFLGAFRLKQRAGLTIPLSDGMCLGTGVLRRHGWRAFGLSEDCETYALLTAAGVPIELDPAAHLYAEEARTLGQSSTQRQRWLAGRLQAIARAGWAVVRSARIGWHQKLDVFAELAGPGPALHLAWAMGLITLAWVVQSPGRALLTALLGAALVRPLVYAVIGLSHHPEPRRALRALLFLPVYAVWRVGLLAGTLRLLRRAVWVRTRRHGPAAPAST